ncbi:hypothetical protein EV193_104123 [Herbihabitans rhizosphaerae]|uniref:YbaB/EbfC DNA-binding family protein n=1 Tax=Herbihabitans rhizosphaerae TaxID=1872711 RepID=A0A4Q7KTY5_9PSEU|nr:YbaB/EbfC family DNA-binding protein [Herbihabitans rhizosphaerae]RZS38912.1 hypothetical protein EV193_104123 [Herbihabitans rhizosphaerae]
MITGSARDASGTVTVEAHPGGALSSLTLTRQARTLGARLLADTILETIRMATAEADQRARNALRDPSVGVGDAQFDALGLGGDLVLVERVESTTPDTWRAR